MVQCVGCASGGWVVCQGPGGGLGHRVHQRNGLGVPFRPLGGEGGAKTTCLGLSTPKPPCKGPWGHTNPYQWSLTHSHLVPLHLGRSGPIQGTSFAQVSGTTTPTVIRLVLGPSPTVSNIPYSPRVASPHMSPHSFPPHSTKSVVGGGGLGSFGVVPWGGL
jgi:hypothetical protein